MNLDKFRPRNETEDLLLSITKTKKTVKRLLNRLKENRKKHLNLKSPGQGKLYNSNQLFFFLLTLNG